MEGWGCWGRLWSAHQNLAYWKAKRLPYPTECTWKFNTPSVSQRNKNSSSWASKVENRSGLTIRTCASLLHPPPPPSFGILPGGPLGDRAILGHTQRACLAVTIFPLEMWVLHWSCPVAAQECTRAACPCYVCFRAPGVYSCIPTVLFTP